MVKAIRALSVVLILITMNAYAKREAPKDVAAITRDGVSYSVPHVRELEHAIIRPAPAEPFRPRRWL
ncbi:MAG TPA: hypothetical protein VGP72_23070 [Planctomycetota bacterium]|jgi:hypothetical protein